MNQVWPHLCFHDDAKAWAYAFEESIDRAGYIIRNIHIENAVTKGFSNLRRPSGCHIGDYNGRIGVDVLQLFNQRCGGDRFAHGHGMHPDALLLIRIFKIAKTLA